MFAVLLSKHFANHSCLNQLNRLVEMFLVSCKRGHCIANFIHHLFEGKKTVFKTENEITYKIFEITEYNKLTNSKENQREYLTRGIQKKLHRIKVATKYYFFFCLCNFWKISKRNYQVLLKHGRKMDTFTKG